MMDSTTNLPNNTPAPRPLPDFDRNDGSQIFDFIQDRADRRKNGLPLGVQGPWKRLDDLLGGGFQPREVYVLGAPPGTGKSALAGRFARHISANGGRALYLSYEIEPDKVRLRALADIGTVRADAFQKGLIDAAELRDKYAEDLATQTGGIDFLDCTQFRPTLDEIEELALRSFEDVDPYKSLLIVDYLQIAGRSAAQESGNSRDEVRIQVANFSARMMKTSRKVGVPVLQLASVNRASYDEKKGKGKDEEGEEPGGADLSAFKEAGDIESDADNCMILGRATNESWRELRRKDIWPLSLHVLKARNGQTGAVPLTFNRPLMRFTCEGE